MTPTTLSSPLALIDNVPGCTSCGEIEEQEQEPNSSPISTPKQRRRSRTNRKRLYQQSLFSDKSLDHHRRRHVLLIHAYIRHVIQFAAYPVELAGIIVSFYDEHIYWTIQGEDMDRFRKTSNGRAMYGPHFELNKHIRFQLTLCPNGWKTNQNGSVQFYIELKHLPSYIEDIVILYQLRNVETGAQCKKIRKFTKSLDAQSWGTNNLRMHECDDNDVLQFIALVKLLRVRFKTESENNNNNNNKQRQLQSLIYIERMQMPKYIEFEWKIEGQLLHEFRHCKQGKFFYSPSFGNGAFCFEIAPNGWHSSNRGRVMVYLRLLQLPPNVANAVCQCHFDSNQRAVLAPSTERITLCYDVHGLEWTLKNASIRLLKESESLILYVKIQVIGKSQAAVVAGS
eukprot:CAMPEP_0202704018 /NCGR_PEP_ID=MMETSP1385-20130828/16776_1 /ASSEMBLY_ACC=CAM_ASM_000861 /TAXON_ID=933848 /ORGANISM="Elphidium margaritaceum" /LENGTH=396 /DNA_ID=CAMNT_0049361957 /DNA_START=53 /DNA_END=1243 /DNA_ORIENTATION=+